MATSIVLACALAAISSGPVAAECGIGGESGDAVRVLRGELSVPQTNVYALGRATSVEPVNGHYGGNGADITFDVAASTLVGLPDPVRLRDSARGGYGLGVDDGRRYFVGLYGDVAGDVDGPWSIWACSYSYAVGDAEYQRILDEFRRLELPDTAAVSGGPQAGAILPSLAMGLLAVAGGLGAVLGLRLRRRDDGGALGRVAKLRKD